MHGGACACITHASVASLLKVQLKGTVRVRDNRGSVLRHFVTFADSHSLHSLLRSHFCPPLQVCYLQHIPFNAVCNTACRVRLNTAASLQQFISSFCLVAALLHSAVSLQSQQQVVQLADTREQTVLQCRNKATQLSSQFCLQKRQCTTQFVHASYGLC